MFTPTEASPAEFAKLRGVKPPMVIRWKEAGRLVLSPDGTQVLIKLSIERISATAYRLSGPGAVSRESELADDLRVVFDLVAGAHAAISSIRDSDFDTDRRMVKARAWLEPGAELRGTHGQEQAMT